MSYASKPGSPRLMETKTANALPVALPCASFNGIEFPTPQKVSSKTGDKSKPVAPKTK